MFSKRSLIITLLLVLLVSAEYVSGGVLVSRLIDRVAGVLCSGP